MSDIETAELSEAGATLKLANATVDTLDLAYTQYHELKAATKRVEEARSKLIGGAMSTERWSAMGRRYLPKILAAAGLVGSGGGLAAFAADSGAFSSILSIFKSAGGVGL